MRRSARVLLVLGALVTCVVMWLWLDTRSAVRVVPERVAEAGRDATTVDVQAAASSAVERRVVDGGDAAGPASGSPPPAESFRVRVRVRVLEVPGDVPLAGARVVFWEEKTQGQSGERTTDARGECSFEVPVGLSSIPLLVEKPGFLHRRGTFNRRNELEIPLHRTTTLSGRLLAADTGEPLPGARILHFHPHCKGCEPVAALAGSDGSYELPGVSLHEPVSVRLEAEDFAGETRRIELRSSGERTSQDFRLERGVAVEGRVVDFVTGSTLSGALVNEQPVDELGRFRIRVLPDEVRHSFELRASAAGYCELQVFDVTEGTAPPELRLPRSAVVEGHVRDALGAPVAGARVRLNEDHRRRALQTMESGEPEPTPLDELPRGWKVGPEGHFMSGSTDETGRFVIANALPWTFGWTLHASAEGFDPGETVLDWTPGPGERVRADVGLVARDEPSHGTVRGTITLNGARQWLTGEVRWKGSSREASGPFSLGAYGQDVEPGRVELSFLLDGLGASVEGGTVVVDVLDGAEVVRDVDLRLPVKPIRGRVTHPGNEPVPEIEVSAFCVARDVSSGSEQRLSFSGVTDEQGTYEIDVPDAFGPYRVSVQLANLERSADGVLAGATGVDFSLPVPGRLLLRAHLAGSERPMNLKTFTILWRTAGEPAFRSLPTHWPFAADADGWYELDLPAGSCDLRLMQPGSSQRGLVPASANGIPVHPEDRAPERVDLELVEGLELVLTASDAAGELPWDHVVFLVERADWNTASEFLAAEPMTALASRVSFDEDRRWQGHGFAPGQELVFLSEPDDLVFEPATIELTADGPRSVEVRWRRR